MFSKHDMLLPKLSFDLPSLQTNISRVVDARGQNYTLINAYGQTVSISKAEVDSRWFNLFSPGRTLAPFESQVMMAAVLIPGCTVSQILQRNPSLGSCQKILGALTRIRTKGCPYLDNFLA